MCVPSRRDSEEGQQYTHRLLQWYRATGCRETYDAVANRCLPYALRIVHSFHYVTQDIRIEAESVARCALASALHSFNDYTGATLLGYISIRVRGSILSLLRSNETGRARLPRYLYEWKRLRDRTIRELQERQEKQAHSNNSEITGQNGNNLHIAGVSAVYKVYEAMGISEAEYNDSEATYNAIMQCTSLDELFGMHDNGNRFEDDVIDRIDRQIQLQRALQMLTDEERTVVISKVVGRNTFDTIGRSISKPTSSARLVYTRAVEKIRCRTLPSSMP